MHTITLSFLSLDEMLDFFARLRPGAVTAATLGIDTDVGIDIDADAAAQDAPVKRGRGRPRKTPPVADAAPSSAAAPSAAAAPQTLVAPVAPAPSPPAVVAPPAAAPAPAPGPAAAPEKPRLTVEQLNTLRSAAMELSRAKGLGALNAVLDSFKVKQLVDLDPAHGPALLTALGEARIAP